MSAPPLVKLQLKLKVLRKSLKKNGNWTVFGNIHSQMRIEEDSETGILPSLNWSDSTLSDLKIANQNLTTLLRREEALMREKSRMKWLKEGGRKAAFSMLLLKRERLNKLPSD